MLGRRKMKESRRSLGLGSSHLLCSITFKCVPMTKVVTGTSEILLKDSQFHDFPVDLSPKLFQRKCRLNLFNQKNEVI